jgi:hypothetical protein
VRNCSDVASVLQTTLTGAKSTTSTSHWSALVLQPSTTARTLLAPCSDSSTKVNRPCSPGTAIIPRCSSFSFTKFSTSCRRHITWRSCRAANDLRRAWWWCMNFASPGGSAIIRNMTRVRTLWLRGCFIFLEGRPTERRRGCAVQTRRE